jgi:hypothetical protein
VRGSAGKLGDGLDAHATRLAIETIRHKRQRATTAHPSPLVGSTGRGWGIAAPAAAAARTPSTTTRPEQGN